jgi:hypothetical protein
VKSQRCSNAVAKDECYNNSQGTEQLDIARGSAEQGKDLNNAAVARSREGKVKVQEKAGTQDSLYTLVEFSQYSCQEGCSEIGANAG